MKNSKKLLLLPALAMLSASTFSMAGCGSQDAIVVWTFSDELYRIAKEIYTPNTGNKVVVQLKSGVAQVQTQLANACKDGVGVPDVVALEAAVVADFATETSDKSLLLPLDDIPGTEDMYDYTKQVVESVDGKILGLSWQATPGGFFYKKRVATKIGLSQDQIENYLRTWEGYLTLAQICKTHNVAVCSSITDPIKVYLSQRENPWVVNNTLQLENVLFGGTQYNCFDTVRTLEQNVYSHGTSERGPGWIDDIDVDDELGYFCSSWGLNFDLIPNASEQSGWAMCRAPYDYFKGGTWLAIPKQSQKIDKAKEFVQYLTTNTEFLKQRCLDTGDFMNNKKVMSEIIKDYHCEFLDGQNHLAILYEAAEHINGNLISPYDAAIDSYFQTSAAEFAQADCETPEEVEESREEWIAAFINLVSKKYKSIIIPDEK